MRDPHQIYDNVAHLFFGKYGCKTILVKRRFFPIPNRPYWLNAIIVTINDSINIINSARYSNRVSVLREFSAIAIVMCFPIAFYARKNVVYNINHNLNSQHQLFLIRLLARFFRFSFIGGGQDVLDLCDKIEIIPFKPKRLAIPYIDPIDQIVVFVGSRPEQRLPGLEMACSEIRRFAEKNKLKCLIVGKNAPNTHQDISADFVDNLTHVVKNSCAVLLYNPKFYSVRHSGVLWEMIENAPAIVSVSTSTISATILSYPGPHKLIHVDGHTLMTGHFKTALTELIGKNGS